MARKPARRPARSRSRRRTKKAGGWVWRVLGLLVLLAAGGAAWWWWNLGEWRPDETAWPRQGAHIGEADGPVSFDTLRGLGARFVYLDASLGAERTDAQFSDHYAQARAERLRIGAVHRFDPCVVADGQSARFVTTVPRDAELLPPAIWLEQLGDTCPDRVTPAAIRSELTTLVNQIEAHAGKPVILAIGEDFEEAYGIATRMDRQIWLHRNRIEPEYGGRPWLIWTANDRFRTEAADAPLRWLVARR